MKGQSLLFYSVDKGLFVGVKGKSLGWGGGTSMLTLVSRRNHYSWQGSALILAQRPLLPCPDKKKQISEQLLNTCEGSKLNALAN